MKVPARFRGAVTAGVLAATLLVAAGALGDGEGEPNASGGSAAPRARQRPR